MILNHKHLLEKNLSVEISAKLSYSKFQNSKIPSTNILNFVMSFSGNLNIKIVYPRWLFSFPFLFVRFVPVFPKLPPALKSSGLFPHF